MARSRKQQDLPGMENRRIEEIHLKAIEYDALKQQHKDLTEKLTAAKRDLLGLMERFEMQERGYSIEGVSVEYVPGKPSEPSVKVTIRLGDADTLEDGQPGESGEAA